MTSHKESGDDLRTNFYFLKSKRFIVSLVQILDKKLVWFGKYSILNVLCSNVYPGRAIHSSSPAYVADFADVLIET